VDLLAVFGDSLLFKLYTTNMSISYNRKFILLCFLLAIAGMSHAQNFRISAYSSYVTEGTYHIYYNNSGFYDGHISAGYQGGAGVEYLIEPSYGIEFTALRRNATAFQESGNAIIRRNSGLTLNYLLLGVNVYPQAHDERLQCFGGISSGVVLQEADGSVSNSGNTTNGLITKFAWGARLGGIFWFTSRVGLKIQTQWLSSLQFRKGIVNFDVFRSYVAPSNYSIANQFEMGGGVMVKLGKAK
jgi:hypothetical protein